MASEIPPPEERTTQRVLALLAAYQAAQISQENVETAIALSIFAGKVLASRLADIKVAALAASTPLGITPNPDWHIPRLQQAANTVLERPESHSESLTALTGAEVLTSSQKALRAAIRQQGFEGYVEQAKANACEICLAANGTQHDSDSDWEPHHPNCRCELVPVGKPQISESKKESWIQIDRTVRYGRELAESRARAAQRP